MVLLIVQQAKKWFPPGIVLRLSIFLRLNLLSNKLSVNTRKNKRTVVIWEAYLVAVEDAGDVEVVVVVEEVGEDLLYLKRSKLTLRK